MDHLIDPDFQAKAPSYRTAKLSVDKFGLPPGTFVGVDVVGASEGRQFRVFSGIAGVSPLLGIAATHELEGFRL